jgi:hypothetical protein
MPDSAPHVPRWALRVPQSLIRRLYESDAQGLYDEDLLNEVGMALYMRCESFIVAVEASRGRAKCPDCGQIVLHQPLLNEVLHCAQCGWECPWPVYFKSFQHKQLSGAEPVLDVFQDFMARFPAATNPRDKMLCIDWLIHNFHRSLTGDPTRTTGINLIEGRYFEVVAFLDKLTYGERSTPGMRSTLAEWRANIAFTAEAWHSQKLAKIIKEREQG